MSSSQSDDRRRDDSRVTLEAVEYQQLRVAAESWWKLWEVGPLVALAPLIDREVYDRIRAASHDVAAGYKAPVGPSRTELFAARQFGPPTDPCSWPGCGRDDGTEHDHAHLSPIWNSVPVDGAA